MKVTDVVVRSLKGKGSLVGFADIVIENSIKISSIRIVDGQNGLFISMPSTSYKDNSGETKYKDIVFPVNKEARKILTDAILAEYRNPSKREHKKDGLFD